MQDKAGIDTGNKTRDEIETTIVADVQTSIDEFRSEGYRLEMIFPADDPREALLSIANTASDPETSLPQRTFIRLKKASASDTAPTSNASPDWIIGRAGMQYRDLIPERVGGKVIASHIRLMEGGEVADYVHYHKIDFQMIYCLRGRIQVVYEDQGPPFWLEPGDCVVQPPEIRHRVLYADAGSEVLEITSPAEHETWTDHDMQLPNDVIDPGREFGGQRFVLTKAK